MARGFAGEMLRDAIEMRELLLGEIVAGHIGGGEMRADAHQSQAGPLLDLMEQFERAIGADAGACHAGVDHHVHMRPAMQHAGDACDIVGGGFGAQHQVPVVANRVFDARTLGG